ncbi:hypothetical protein B0H13DRAFT_2357917 [Mycena leptocephala]|nr:hypothetical protein B0H13DRAFT_2357917 [Mycena leptocephala]
MPTFFGSFRKSHLKPGPLAPREPSMCTHPHCTQPLFRRPYRRTVSPRSSSQALQQPVASQDPSDARHRQRGQAGRARDEVGQHHAVESARGHSEVDIISDRSAAAVPALSAPGAGFGLAHGRARVGAALLADRLLPGVSLPSVDWRKALLLEFELRPD